MNFLPFALASLRAGKTLLSLNLFFLILNCHPLLGLMDLLKAGLIHFLCIYTQLPCLWFVKRVYYNWILGLCFSSNMNRFRNTHDKKQYYLRCCLI
ncbi:hypothetical protein GYH30_027022 [Glycine max]|uniref:Uncharacterized protein n=1 Tax=Glycine max TaxID=3847 RepID=K7LHJ6_SOYBN|nr:hypothetical protein GYH30_027022 [Glycine max]